MVYNIHLISLPEFNLLHIASFTWLTPPGPYRVTTCRREGIKLFWPHKDMEASPDEWSAQCREQLRDSTHMKDNTHQAHIHSNKANMKWCLWRPNDIRGTCGPKVSWHLSYRWGKTPKNPHPGNLFRPGMEHGSCAWRARMLPPVPQRWTLCTIHNIKIIKVLQLICRYQNSTKLCPNVFQKVWRVLDLGNYNMEEQCKYCCVCFSCTKPAGLAVRRNTCCGPVVTNY